MGGFEFWANQICFFLAVAVLPLFFFKASQVKKKKKSYIIRKSSMLAALASSQVTVQSRLDHSPSSSLSVKESEYERSPVTVLKPKPKSDCRST